MATVGDDTRAISPQIHTPDAGSDMYLRVQLPNDNTTVIMVKNDMTMWEILNVISVKKELMPSQHTLKVLFMDGKDEPAQPERTLSSYQNIERVVISKNQVQAGKNRVGRRTSIVAAPSTRHTVIRPLTQEFPKTVTDQNDPLLKTSAYQKASEYQHLKKGGKAIKSLSMMLFKRTSTEIGGFDMSAFDPPGSLTPSEDNRSSSSLGNHSESDGEIDETRSQQSVDRHDTVSILSQAVTSLSTTSISDPNMLGINEYTSSKRPESVASFNSLTMADRETQVASPLHAEQASPLGSVSTIQSRLDNNSQEVGTLSERRLRRRAVSNPTPKAPASLLKKSPLKKIRPRANTDTILQATADILNDANLSEKAVAIRVLLPSLQAVNLKLPTDMRMDYVLFHVCQTNGLEFESFSLKVFDKNITIEMDRALGFYFQDHNLSEFLVVHGEKFYRTRCINEDGKDVMIFEVVQDRLQVMAGTPEKLIERLTDEDEKDTNFLDTLLLTFRSFMSPDDFFQNLLDRFNCELPTDPNPEDMEYFKKMKSPVQKGWWVEHHWHDFGVNPQLRKDLEEFVYELKSVKETDFSVEYTKLIELMMAQGKRYEDMILSYRSVERKGKTMESMFAELAPEELGQQLCLHDFKLFKNIHPIEFLHQIWKKDEDGTPILDFFIERFDKESYWAVTEIVSQKDPKKRVNILRKFILTAKDLTFINDGNPSQVKGMVNFDKLRMMGKRVKDISSLVGTAYKFEANPAIQNYLAKPPIEKSMTKLKELSLECEK
ncbi:hypothetical protein HDU67_010159 [Dinochytrium kinnereticum]|nr:hypothetical protein HDU67_010159 [Dinochytrium kinnereticum]